jgi:hypothetical protein
MRLLSIGTWQIRNDTTLFHPTDYARLSVTGAPTAAHTKTKYTTKTAKSPSPVTAENATDNYVDICWLTTQYCTSDPTLSSFAIKGCFMSSSPNLDDEEANVCDEVRSLILECPKHLPTVPR